jgi:pimeloyl-ACP methyl ester carboxylesterase
MTAVLIHGGGATGAFWDRLVPFLDAPPLVVDLPGRRGRPAALQTLTVDAEVASVVADIGAGAPEGPVTLVAHSSGGLVVPGVVAALDGRAGAIVLNAALVPAEGECGIACMQERHRDGLRAAVAAAGVPITYVLNERDRPIRPDLQEVMARRLPPPVEVIRLDSGHLLPVTSPAVFAQIVNRVAA